jgi:sulfide dehydrogenase cytochrome subunit
VKRRLIAAPFMLAIASTALAQVGEPSPGRTLAAACANCHGTGGHAVSGMPVLAAMPETRLIQFMREFKSGVRPATVMQQIAKGYTDEQLKSLAAFFAGQSAAGRSR